MLQYPPQRFFTDYYIVRVAGKFYRILSDASVQQNVAIDAGVTKKLKATASGGRLLLVFGYSMTTLTDQSYAVTIDDQEEHSLEDVPERTFIVPKLCREFEISQTNNKSSAVSSLMMIDAVVVEEIDICEVGGE